jgi:thiamine kinase-like enzyme
VAAYEALNDREREDFYRTMLPLEQKNLERVYEDVAWFVEKYDYTNKDADWKNSKDAIQRGMQKLRGGDPSLPVYQIKK